MENINENSVENFEKQIANLFKRLRTVDEKDYLKVMQIIEFYKSKYFILAHKPKKTFREYVNT